ncbi:MAG: CHRD domain-containing protein [Planctomycetaceae bacterium]|nr:MAG: CHRD domain-containing protein [Planctomycetaceae bacterium]
MAAFAGSPSFSAHLAGRNEVPAVDTLAQGQAHFKLSEDGTALEYKLIAANVENILQSHIHVGAAGTNGPVVVFLYPDAPPAVLIPGRFDGVLAEGVITSADLIGPLTGMTLDDLLAAIEAGNAYVNLHTSQFPGGEIRGQIR